MAALLLAVVLPIALPGCQRDGGSRPPQGMRDLWRDYLKLPKERALAVAGDPHRHWVAGAAGGEASPEAASQAALDACKERRVERRIQAPCRVFALDDQIVW